MVKEIYGSNKCASVPTLIDNGRHYTTDHEKASLLCNYFTEQCTLPTESSDYTLPDFKYITNARIDNVDIDEGSVQ